MVAALAISTQSDSPANPFDYTGLAEPDRLWLKRTAASLRARLRRTVREMVEAGNELVRARRRLGRGQWEGWLANEAQVAKRSASRLAAVGRVFGQVAPEILDRFTGTALYVLAEPGTPHSLREYAVQQAADGDEVTAASVREWIVLYRDTALGGTKEASKSEAKPKEFSAAETNAPDNWRRIDALVKHDNTLHLTHAADVENGDSFVSGVLVSAEGTRSTASGPTLESVVLSLSGGARTKQCARMECGKTKPLDQFSLRRDKPDGRNRYCLECERVRVRTYAREKAAAARETRVNLASASGAA